VPSEAIRSNRDLTLSDVIDTLSTLGKAQLPGQIARWLDLLDETGRWALLKLLTGGLRVGVSARLAKTAAAALGNKDPQEIELIWPGLKPPYQDLFAWLEGRADKPVHRDPAPFRPAMLAHAVMDGDLSALAAEDFMAEWKWDGIRVQAVADVDSEGQPQTRLYSRTGEDISASFPDLVDALRLPGAIDGELLVVREGLVQSFNVLQQRLNRKTVNAKLLADFPAHLRAYDLLVDGADDLREEPFATRRVRLEAFVARLKDQRVDLSPLIPFATWDELAAARANPTGLDAEAIEGVMLKRRDAPYVPGRPKGLWWKWKRDPLLIDAVLMYAQRGHGKRSSFYSDYTFGVWKNPMYDDIRSCWASLLSASARRSEARARSTGRVSIERSCCRQSTTPVQLREARCRVASRSSGSAERTEASAALNAATARADWSRCSW